MVDQQNLGGFDAKHGQETDVCVSVTPPVTSVNKESFQGKDEDLDDLLKPLGGFGKYQILSLFFLSTIVIVSAYSEMGFVLTAAELKHRCFISECEEDYSSYDKPWLSSAIPKIASGSYDSCRRFNNSTGYICQNRTVTGEAYLCDSFIFETNEKTIASENWGISCDEDKWKLTLIGSLNNAGQMLGCFYVGVLADRFGRKMILLIYGVLVAAIGTIKSFSVSYIMMAILELLEASMAPLLFNGPFILAMEVVESEKRVLAGMIVSIVYAAGEMIMGVIQMLTLDWRTSLRIMYIPFFLMIFYKWTIPESMRWLISNNRHGEAFEILKKIAKVNGTEISPDLEMKLYKIKIEEKVDESKWRQLTEIWNSKTMRTRSFVCLYIWLVSTFVFFGISMTAVSITEDKFLNFILSSFIEIPSYLAVYFLLDRLGRRHVLSGFLILCGVGCILSAYAPEDWSWAKLLLFLIGKFCASIAFTVLHVYTTELFPTNIRSSAMGLGLTIGKLATVVAPQMPLLADYYKPLPLLIFSGLSLIAGAASLQFPETLNTKLPDTIKEAENLGKEDKKNMKWGSSTNKAYVQD